MISIRNQLAQLVEGRLIDPGHIDKALALVGVYPSTESWQRFLDKLLLWLGCLSIAFSVLFFIAFNWELLGRFAKFAMVEALIIAAIATYWRLSDHPLMSKVALLMAAIFLGVLLALFGQTYQTGADPWQLFFTWAMLMLPWAAVGRFPAIWLLWLALLNTATVLYYDTFGRLFGVFYSSDESLYWTLFAFNVLALVIWELLASQWDWLDERWSLRFIATASGVIVTWLATQAIVDSNHTWGVLVWLAFTIGLYVFYRHFKHDLFMLSGAALSSITVIMVFLNSVLPISGGGTYLLFAITLIGLGSGAAVWLGRIHKEWSK